MPRPIVFPDGPERAELIAEFVAESREHLSEVESQLLEVESSGDELNLPVVNAVFRCVHSIKGAAGMLGFSTITELAHELESVLNMIRNQVDVPDSAVIDSLLRASDALKELLVDVESSEGIDVSRHIDDLRSILEPGSGGDESAKHGSIASPSEIAAAPGSEANIRVSVGMLDRLMNLAGELVLSRNELVQAIATSDQRMIDSASTRIDRVTSDLQGAIMQTRMQPIGSILLKCRRVVRDLAQKLGKECRLLVDGKNVELDRAILEMISAPLTHLVRNAMDHGIEAPNTREAQGKRRTGTISIRRVQLRQLRHALYCCRPQSRTARRGCRGPLPRLRAAQLHRGRVS